MTPEEHIARIRHQVSAGVTARLDSAVALCDAYEALAAAAREVVNRPMATLNGRGGFDFDGSALTALRIHLGDVQ